MTPRLLPGQLIPGTRYRVLAKIGQGAMGVVHAAEHVDLEKRVAIKLLAGKIARKPDAVERFRQEARAASKIGSPYICDVTDFGTLQDGRVFFVMEYLDGRSLRAVLDNEGRLGPARVIAILRQVAKALGAAHEKGITHLDIKPDNVMLLDRGSRADAVKVVDFGIAGLIAMGRDAREAETVNGTPAYMAPERALGRGYDHRSDIYSLGVMAYEMLCGSIPFDSEDVVTTLRKHVSETPEPPRDRLPDHTKLPGELEEVVLRMLEKDPTRRPQNMAEVEALLCEAQIAAGLQTAWDDLELPHVDEAWRIKLAERMPSPRTRRTRALIGAAMSVAGGALALAIYLGTARKTEIITERVEITRTEEPVPVAEALHLAHRAAQAGRYVPPPDEDTALSYIYRAEQEAEKLGVVSAGARTLRQAYANALAASGNDLLQAGLRDFAIAKYKQALLFDPANTDLQSKAALTPSEKRQYAAAAQKRSADRPAKKIAAVPPEEQAQGLASSLFIAARDGHMSEARATMRELAKVDRGGQHTARVADALRPFARAALAGGRAEDARALYAIIAELDPSDAEAKDRARTPLAKPGPEAPAAAPAAVTDPVAARGTRRPVDDEVPRDVSASKAAAQVGIDALSRGRLDEAEAAFRRAIKFDPLNAVAVGGMAEVAFERARYTDALDYGRKATRMAPKSPRFLTILGDAYFKLLRYVEARTAYERALALAPHDATLRIRIDRVKARIGER